MYACIYVRTYVRAYTVYVCTYVPIRRYIYAHCDTTAPPLPIAGGAGVYICTYSSRTGERCPSVYTVRHAVPTVSTWMY